MQIPLERGTSRDVFLPTLPSVIVLFLRDHHGENKVTLLHSRVPLRRAQRCQEMPGGVNALLSLRTRRFCDPTTTHLKRLVLR